MRVLGGALLGTGLIIIGCSWPEASYQLLAPQQVLAPLLVTIIMDSNQLEQAYIEIGRLIQVNRLCQCKSRID